MTRTCIAGLLICGLVSGSIRAQEQGKAEAPPELFRGLGGAPVAGALPVGLDGRQADYLDIVRDLRKLDYQTVEPTDLDAKLSLEDLRRGQLAWREALQSLQFSFVMTSDRKLELTVEKNLEKQGRLVPSTYSFALTFAMKGAQRYQTYREIDPTEKVVKKAAGEPAPTHFAAFNGEQTRNFEPNRLLGTVRPGKEAGIDGNANEYLAFVSIPIGANADTFTKTVFYVPSALQTPQFYKVLPKLEKVDGYPCHVVSAGWDVLWIDADHGFCVRRRVDFRRVGPNDPGCLSYVQICKDFVEADKGIFLPRLCHRVSYATQTEPKSLWGKMAKVITVTLSDLQVNNIPDSRFDFVFPPGTQVNDLITNKSYLVPHGEENLEEAIKRGNPIVDDIVVRANTPVSRLRTILWVSNGLLLAGFLVALGRRYLRRSHAVRAS